MLKLKMLYYSVGGLLGADERARRVGFTQNALLAACVEKNMIHEFTQAQIGMLILVAFATSSVHLISALSKSVEMAKAVSSHPSSGR